MKICTLVGNPKPGSRTFTLAQSLAFSLVEAEDTVVTIDLAEHAEKMFQWPSEDLVELTELVAKSDLIIVGSPTYKATFTGLLKSFLDRYPTRGLENVCAIPLMTGADKGHSMAPDVNLRPLLVELGAILPTRAFYFETSQMDRMENIVTDWISENSLALRQIRQAAIDRQLVGGSR